MPDHLIVSAIFAAAFVCSAILTKLARGWLLRRVVMDIPNDRSMHAAPIPRGGGIAVMATIIAGLCAFAVLFPAGREKILAIGAAAMFLSGVSWLDDKRGLSAKWRLAAHIVAAVIGVAALPSGFSLANGLLPQWLELAVLVLGWAWFINLYNFMDGIDGITGTETVSIALGVAVVAFIGQLSEAYGVLASILAGASAGFLLFNWHPAKIFLGDVGSVPLGFVVGWLLLSLAGDGYWAAALILPLYYLADSGITLGKRIARGERIWEAHRSHFYQRAAQSFKSHSRAVLLIAAANAALIASAAVSLAQPIIGLAMAVAAVAATLFVMRR